MSDYKFILFDCMETLIDMVELPGEKEYALWALEGSGAEAYWQDSEEFVQDFVFMRTLLKERQPSYKEFDINERFQLIVERKLGSGKTREAAPIVEQLVANYWRTYLKMCYLAEEVRETLAILAGKYRMGVVSNFIVPGGVEQILQMKSIHDCFQFVVTSVNEGWRKPHPQIYEAALQRAGVADRKEVLFIGDDLENDYLTPQKLGMTAILYDRNQKCPALKERFTSFRDLVGLLRWE